MRHAIVGAATALCGRRGPALSSSESTYSSGRSVGASPSASPVRSTAVSMADI